MSGCIWIHIDRDCMSGDGTSADLVDSVERAIYSRFPEWGLWTVVGKNQAGIVAVTAYDSAGNIAERVTAECNQLVDSAIAEMLLSAEDSKWWDDRVDEKRDGL
uniref:Uncharacterized protein n=1 Tax=viral metagenome TaxID=1070528 RepID=A0A6M3L4P7_9ZZZZ